MRALPRYAGTVFRRRGSAPEADDQAPAETAEPEQAPQADDRPGLTLAKGRPTPKRSEAERRRRQPYSPPADRKEAARQSRERDQDDRTKRSAALRRGEEWALPAKDKGPLRKLARDYVDSRRGITQYYIFVILAFFIISEIPPIRGSASLGIIDYVLVVLLAVCAIECLRVTSQVRKLARERYPDESTRGLALYAITRSAQIRRMRVPGPTVKPGDTI